MAVMAVGQVDPRVRAHRQRLGGSIIVPMGLTRPQIPCERSSEECGVLHRLYHLLNSLLVDNVTFRNVICEAIFEDTRKHSLFLSALCGGVAINTTCLDVPTDLSHC